MTEELKPLPCPFCGCDEFIDLTPKPKRYVCGLCGAEGPGGHDGKITWNTRSPAWRDDMDAAKEYQNSRHSRGDDRLGVIVACQWGSRWSANHAWWNDHEEEWNDISGDQIVRPVYWAPLPPKLKAGGEHDNDK